MKLLVMAAGRGTRISRYIEGMPKCTVDIGGARLVEYTIQKFLDMGGISRIGIVLGYRSEILEEILSGYPVEFYYNYFYEVTNSIASAWFAKDFIDDDMVMMNADVFAEEKYLTCCCQRNAGTHCFCLTAAAKKWLIINFTMKMGS